MMETILSQSFDQESINEAKAFMWGVSTCKEEVFSRWNQGFVFSETTPCALMQLHGGPCAVIASVQAFIIKCALFSEGDSSLETLTIASEEQSNSLLLDALTEILSQMNSSAYTVVSWSQDGQSDAESTTQHKETASDATARPSTANSTSTEPAQSISSGCFHSNLRYQQCNNVTELREILRRNLTALHSNLGVLLYLYSILFTKGIQQIKNEVEDPSEPLIDNIHGHGSQSLINLLLTSMATSNVWDYDKDISGLKLRGLQHQSTIGFLTLLEHMRYCEVGWFYKNPLCPVWILASETHLSVLFSQTKSLVIRDSPQRNAKQIFSHYDPEGNGFISSSLLDDVMQALDLVSEKEYVDLMRTKLDSEELGIITRNSFLEEFFPEDPGSEMPKEFTLYHYNGLRHANPEGKVCFSEGKAKLEDEIDTQFITDSSPMKMCLQTKWPSIEITWASGTAPSLN